MNTLRNLIMAGVLLCTCLIQAQAQSNDIKDIEHAISSYITNFFLNKYDEMEIHMHDRLSKRGIDQSGKLSGEFPKEKLKELMAKKSVLPLDLQENIITEISVHNRVAQAVLETGYPGTRWKEYIHLIKLDGRWLIGDVMWIFDDIDDSE